MVDNILMLGINNTTIVEKFIEYGKVIQWELQHRCVGDCWQTITMEDIKEDLKNKTCPKCFMCGKKLIKYEDIKKDA